MRRCMAENRRSGLLPYIHTANTARDLNSLRAAVGDRKLTYLGYSYGTQIGATYATFFPRRVRALALDGAVDAEGFVNDPIRDFRRQTESFEDVFDRFLAGCRIRPDHCGLGAAKPGAAYDALAKRLDQRALPAAGAANPTPVGGDDLRAATLATLPSKPLWAVLSNALIGAQRGDGSLLRIVADVFYEREETGIFDPFVAISALDGHWPAKPLPYLRDGRSAYRRFGQFWWNAGYSELAMGLWPVKPRGGHVGPGAELPAGHHRPGGGHHARSIHPIRVGEAADRRPGQRSAAHDAGRRSHRVVRRQLPVHRHGGTGIPRAAPAARAEDGLPAGGSLRDGGAHAIPAGRPPPAGEGLDHRIPPLARPEVSRAVARGIRS